MFKKITYSLFFCLFAVLTMSVAVSPATTTPSADAVMAETGLSADAFAGVDDFLNLTPKQYRQITGKKLSLKEAIVLKLAQKKIKKQIRQGKRADDIPVSKGIFIVLAIFVPIAAVIMMGLADEWSGNRWWLALLLYALCYLPGLIYTLTKLNDFSYSD